MSADKLSAVAMWGAVLGCVAIACNPEDSAAMANGMIDILFPSPLTSGSPSLLGSVLPPLAIRQYVMAATADSRAAVSGLGADTHRNSRF